MDNYRSLPNEENEEVIKLSKFGCGLRLRTAGLGLAGLGSVLSVGGLAVGLLLVLTPWTGNWHCGLRSRDCSLIYIIGASVWIFSLLWFFFSINLMRKSKARHMEDMKKMVKIACSVIGSLQIIGGSLSFASYMLSVNQYESNTELAAKIVWILSSVSLIVFSGLLLVGVRLKKTTFVQIALYYNLVVDFYLLINFSLNVCQADRDIISVIGLIINVIHLVYCNTIILAQYNVLVHDMGYYKKNLQFFTSNFHIQA